MPFELWLVDPNIALVHAWKKAFAAFPEITILEGKFEEVEMFDCMVSAANSFGLMDGGVDLAISNFFGWDLQQQVQQRIIAEYWGEQPVGTSMIVETGHPNHPYIAHTPTMRVPMRISGTDQVYLAMKAMLEAVERHNQHSGKATIQKVLCPGLGTATGRMPFEEAARQMAVAYEYFLRPPTYIDWRMAEKRQRTIKYGGMLGKKD
ncbi:MAG: macro domain-containing protein [Bacteroidota bacterium]